VTIGPPDPDGRSPVTAVDRIVERARGLRPWSLGLIAFGCYLVASFAQWTASYVTHFASRFAGVGGSDEPLYEWSLTWTPWALSHTMNPLYTDRVFAPNHVNLAWVTFVPGPSLVMWPVTHLLGAMVSLNLLLTLAPPLAAWGAYLVCHRVTRAFWPSLAGGYFFGFSAYMVAQMNGHVNLVLIFPVPIAVYLVIRRIEGSLGWVAFLALMTLSLVGLFSISTELFAMATLFGLFALAIALVAARDRWMTVLHAGLMTALAYLAAGLILLPYLVTAFRSAPEVPVRPVGFTSIDLLSPIVPRRPILLEGKNEIARSFTASPGEDAGYLGIPLLILLVAFAVTERRRRGTWALLSFVALVYVFSLGPVLNIRGDPHTKLFPGTLLSETPFLKHATPQRFPGFAALAIAVIVSLWLVRSPRKQVWIRYGLVALAAVVLLPAVSPAKFHRPRDLPPFWSSPVMAQELRRDENAFVIPARFGYEMAAQAESGFFFRMPQAYVGPYPEGVPISPLRRGLWHGMGSLSEPSPETTAAWLTERGVTAVVVDNVARSEFEPLLRSVGLVPLFEGGGVSVWRSPSGTYRAVEPTG
jgi:hypothetical protein